MKNNKININKFERIMPKKNWQILSLLLLIFGLGLFILSVNDYIKLHILKSHELVVGDVISADLTYNPYNATENGDWYPKYEYKYTVNGIEYEDYDVIRTTGIFTHISNDNKKIKIIYDKNDPTSSKVFYIDYRGILISLLFIVISIFVYIKTKKNKS